MKSPVVTSGWMKTAALETGDNAGTIESARDTKATILSELADNGDVSILAPTAVVGTT
jgi:hypothetical protein